MGFFKEFKNLAETVGEGIGEGAKFVFEPQKGTLYSGLLDFVPLGGTVGIHGYRDPADLAQPVDPEDFKFTNPGEEDAYNFYMAMGYDVAMETINARLASGQALTAEDLATMSQIAGFTASIVNKTADVSSTAAMEMLSYVTSAAEGDFSSPKAVLAFAQLAPPEAPMTEEDDLTKSLMEQQTLVMEQQRIETMTARRNYEREGILSVIQMLPSGNRLQFMSAMFQTPHFSELFFGSLDAGYSDGPYVGGVIGSLGGGGGSNRFSGTPGSETRNLSAAEQIKAWSQ